MLRGAAQYFRAAVRPVVNPPLTVAGVQVAQQGGDHFKTGGHLPQVLVLRGGLLRGHEPVCVDLEQKILLNKCCEKHKQTSYFPFLFQIN